jgi:hypothetical protein
MKLEIKSIIGSDQTIRLDVSKDALIEELKNQVNKHLNIQDETLCLISNGRVLQDHLKIMAHGIRAFDILTIMPREITAGLDQEELMKEYGYIREQFPLVKTEDLMTYRGRLRCERGYTMELARRGIWPFTQFIEWHEFKMELSYLHPFKPPIVTWLTDIDHPNIIPAKRGKVCVSLLGKKWLPTTKLAAIINSLYYLLLDPNPYSAYRNKRCKEAAKICRMYGFPLKRGAAITKPPEYRGRR